MTKTHYIFGRGPNKELKFNIEVDVEDECQTCVHRNICARDMQVCCPNFDNGRWEENRRGGATGCFSCSHSYTRFDGKTSVTCFTCNYYEADKDAVQEAFDLNQALAHHEFSRDDFWLLVNIAKSKYHEKVTGSELEKSTNRKKLPKVPISYIIKWIEDDMSGRKK
jgi:hypothetical protein